MAGVPPNDAPDDTHSPAHAGPPGGLAVAPSLEPALAAARVPRRVALVDRRVGRWSGNCCIRPPRSERRCWRRAPRRA